MREYVDNFYASVEKSGFVTLEDFAELMDFMRIAWDADTEEVQRIITEVYLKCTEIHNRLHQ